MSAFASTINNGSVDKENLAMVNMRMNNGGIAHLQANFAADDHGSDPWSCYGARMPPACCLLLPPRADPLALPYRSQGDRHGG